MKKTLTLLVVLAVLSSLVACNDNGIVGDVGNENLGDVGLNASIDDFDTTATVEETVLYNDNDVVITANELLYSAYNVKLSVTIENNSEKQLSFVSGSIGYSVNSVNGYMVEGGYVNCDIPGGESQTEEVSFNVSTLNSYGITKIADMEIGFQISDEDYNNVYTGPLQVKTSVFDSFDYTENHYQKIIKNGAFENEFDCKIKMFSDKELYNDFGISIISATVAINQDDEPILMLEVKNTNSDIINVSTNEVYLNDFLVYESMWSSDAINGGKSIVIPVSLQNLAEEYEGDVKDLEKLEKITFNFSVGENWYDSSNCKQISIELPNIKVSVEAED